MKYYGNERTGKLLHCKEVYGLKDTLNEFGYVDILEKNKYNFQRYYVFHLKNGVGYSFIKTMSDNKANGYLLTGWTLISKKGTNEVFEEYIETIEEALEHIGSK